MASKDKTENLTKYQWWGQANSPPERLKTRKQLSELGLSPIAPVGVIHTSNYDLLLFDPASSASVKPKRKPSKKQLEALKKGRMKSRFKSLMRDWRRNSGKKIQSVRIDSIYWAREVLANGDFWRILDTETTGLDHNARIIEIAITDLKGKPLVNTLVQPTQPYQFESNAIAIHDITPDMLTNAPSFKSIFPDLQAALQGCDVLIYNSNFDCEKIEHECNLASLPALFGSWLDTPANPSVLLPRPTCLMSAYAAWYGDYSEYHGDFRCQPLGGRHRALEDCQTATKRLLEMAEDTPKIQYWDEIVELAAKLNIQL